MRKQVIRWCVLGFAAGLTIAAFGQGAGRVGRPQFGGNVPADLDTLSPPLTAGTVQTQAGATLCNFTICVVGTNATSGNGVALYQCAIAPQRVTVVNETSNPVQVYGSGTDTINGVATGTGVSQAATSKAEYICTQGGVAATWWH
jgi:hypothetical protein